MNIGKAIKELRTQKKVSQKVLAEKTSITQAALSAIENGARPNPENLKKICQALEVPESLIYIMGLEKEDVPDEKKVLYEELFPVIETLIRKVAMPTEVN